MATALDVAPGEADARTFACYDCFAVVEESAVELADLPAGTELDGLALVGFSLTVPGIDKLTPSARLSFRRCSRQT